MTNSSVASSSKLLAEDNHLVAVPPQWLPVLLASSPTSLPLPPPSPPPPSLPLPPPSPPLSRENPVHTLGLAARQNAEMCALWPP